MLIMILIGKIFFMCNQIVICPYLLQPAKIAPWINLFIQILETQLGPEFESVLTQHD